MKNQVEEVLKDESGEFGIKQIAITVAVIVVIGFIVSTVKSQFLADWIEDIWTMLVELIEDTFSSN